MTTLSAIIFQYTSYGVFTPSLFSFLFFSIFFSYRNTIKNLKISKTLLVGLLTISYIYALYFEGRPSLANLNANFAAAIILIVILGLGLKRIAIIPILVGLTLLSRAFLIAIIFAFAMSHVRISKRFYTLIFLGIVVLYFGLLRYVNWNDLLIEFGSHSYSFGWKRYLVLIDLSVIKKFAWASNWLTAPDLEMTLFGMSRPQYFSYFQAYGIPHSSLMQGFCLYGTFVFATFLFMCLELFSETVWMRVSFLIILGLSLQLHAVLVPTKIALLYLLLNCFGGKKSDVL